MLLRTLSLFSFLAFALPASGQLIISEFLASNSNSIRDENNNTEDWIEIQNTSASVVNLQGWYLTDEEDQPRKWAFPAWTLNAGGFVVVFASEKDRKPNQAVAGQDNSGAAGQTKLHTNFKLSDNGEYLALTRDIAGGGVQVVQVMNTYPVQATDVAYGTQVTTTVTPLVSPGAAAKVLVPSTTNGGSSLPYAAWTGAAAGEPFDDSAWTSGTTAIGFPNAGVIPANLKLRLNSDAGTTAVNDTSGAAHHGTNAGATWVATSTDANGRTRHGALQFNATDANGGLTGDQVVVPAHADFNVTSGTIMFWIKTAGNIADGGNVEGAMLFDRRAGTGVGQGLVVYLRDLGNIQIQPSPGGGTQPNTFQSTGTVKDDRWHHVAIVLNTASGLPCSFYIDGNLSGSQVNNGAWSFNASQQIEIGRSHDTYWRRFNGQFDDYRFYNTTLTQAQIQQIYNNEDEPLTPGLDIASAMQNQNPSAFVRIPFNVPDASAFAGLDLTMRWNDGYVAWLNGTEISSFAAPATPAYNSTATQSHSAGAPLLTSVASPATTLRNGTNILAIQALNNTAANATFSVLPELVGTNSTIGQAGYLVTPTPGAVNAGAKTNLGPFVSGVTSDLTFRPTGDASSPAATIIAKVAPSLRPLAATNPVQLKYRIMYAPEVTLNMTALGNGMYSAPMPTNIIGPGQMLRWRVVATDNTGATGTAPEYSDPTDNDQYYGAVAVDNTIETNLTVLYFFVQDPNAANNATGTRCSIFYRPANDPGLGRFYDNVEVNIHGQSSSGFNKKSYDLDFNEDNRFVWSLTESRVKDINLMTNWGDKSKVHNTLTHEALKAVGSAHHWCFPVRVQQVTPANAASPASQFFSIADMMEDGDDIWLDRVGLDGDGALYKAYNNLTSSGSLEKKTRQNETKADADAFIAGINPGVALATRRRYSYDNIDLPQCVSYFVGLAIASSQDHGHKNYYIYRDTDGTREWSILPWDTDLSWGRNWTDAGGYFTDTVYTNNALNHYPGYNDGTAQTSVQNKGVMNPLYQVIFDTPEFRKMYLRRLRTVMDTYFAPSGIEARVNALTDSMDPPSIGTSDADRDRTRWNSWGNDGGLTIGGQVLRFHTNILNTNYLTGRRNWLNSASAVIYYADPATPGLDSEAIPTSQPTDAAELITIETVDYNPPSGNQGHEYFVIRNSNPYAVDISGWQLTGAVRHTFKGGTVIPSSVGAVENIGNLFVAKNPAVFRQRTTAPTANQFCFVQGPYEGQLSARGETIELRDAQGVLLKTKSWAPAPTPMQNFLRVTELNYAPVGPTQAEIAALPGVVERDFEFLELMNTGATPLVLTGAHFDRGVDFTFPTFTLPAGARCLLVANQAAFQLRYGAAANIAGVYSGNLDNNGETLQLLDNVGESILEFRYESTWFPPSDEGGRSLVVRTANPDWQTYDEATQWALSGTVGGSPGAADTSLATVYEGWRWDHFTSDQMPTPTLPNLPAALFQDPDGDGMSNILEYAFGRTPTDNESDPPLVTPSIVNVGGTNYLAVTFRRRTNALDLTYVVEVTGDLTSGSWTSLTQLVGAPTSISDYVEEVTFRDEVPHGPASPRFIRVRAVKP